ncbi:hypothetical protein AABB24_032589 [Solanum stoloniferum]|uniref:Uncharacterized protein n=1 Tax=Solanum stoloniferum TaxID=62892 RepID=A0ABD2RJZ5_9SOLN
MMICIWPFCSPSLCSKLFQSRVLLFGVFEHEYLFVALLVLTIFLVSSLIYAVCLGKNSLGGEFVKLLFCGLFSVLFKVHLMVKLFSFKYARLLKLSSPLMIKNSIVYFLYCISCVAHFLFILFYLLGLFIYLFLFFPSP